jgi:GDPmannose 4,6-dehydratase
VDEKGLVKSIAKDVQAPIKSGDVLIELDPRYLRPTEVDFLKADITKARKELGWEPKITFEDLARIMVDYDFDHFGLTSGGEGKKILLDKGIEWTKNKLTIG